jgi:hypothetical protein
MRTRRYAATHGCGRPRAHCAWGVIGGRVVGRSDDLASEPAETPLTPQDIIATIYTLLGISPEQEFTDRVDRPLKILNGTGRFIRELL